ncbi:hypothetical protein NE235_17235 [Actinoallomurus spadix]|uniref:Uncharacterized protein n=1 Tax=Actinoallomurus spadix TaxID=79912 RepID=A0ABN0XAH0_9ACTN|nr:hypothetical protein [Actinoallomurus spadix]MCO5987847.1 hypothetical protein [Actinoallomurus spadix]
MRRRTATLATVATALTLATTGPLPTSHAAPRPAHAPDRATYPNGYRGIAVHGGTPVARGGATGDALGMLRKSKPLSSVRAASAAAGTHTLTVDLIDRNGAAPRTADAQNVFFLPLDGSTPLYGQAEDGHLTAGLPPGEYVVEAGVTTPQADAGRSLTLVYLPRLDIDRDRTVTLDARLGRPMSIAADRPDARLTGGDGGGGLARVVQDIGGRTTTTANVFLDGTPTYVTPTGRAPGLALLMAGRLTKAGAVMGSPYIYNVAGSTSDAEVIPAEPVLRVRTADLAAVRTRYARQGEPGCAGTHAAALLPGGGFDEGFFVGVGPMPAVRTEYFSPGVGWDTDTVVGPDCSFEEGGVMGVTERFSQAGTYTRDRTTGPLGPGADYNAVTGDGTLLFWVPMLSSWGASSGIAPYDRVTGRTTLQDATGKVTGTSDQPGYGEFPLPPGQGTYKVTTDLQRQAPWSDLATRQHVVWTFSANVPDGDAVGTASLLSVLYRTPLDDDNRAPAGTQRIDLDARTDGQGPAPVIRRMTAQVSYDDGATWTNAPVARTTDGWTATVRNPQGTRSGYVSLRTVAEDTAGRTVDQTIVHAYGLKP